MRNICNHQKTKSRYSINGEQLAPFPHELFGFLANNSVVYPVPVFVLPHVTLSQSSSRFPGSIHELGWLITGSQNHALQSQNFG